MDINTQKHMQFLKKPENRLEIGHMIPNVVLHNEAIGEIELYSLMQNNLLIIFISTTCISCIDALDALDEYMKQDHNFNVVLLVDGEDDEVRSIATEFENKQITIFSYAKKDMDLHVGVKLLPWSYGINKKGQVITSYNCSNLEFLEMTMQPFLISDANV